MRYIFATIGGSGSTYLVRKLSSRCEVGNKPDTVFQAPVDGLEIDQGTFEERSDGFPVKEGESLEEMLARYIPHVQASAQRTTVLNTAAERGMLSKMAVRDVVFLVRHPLHAYVSPDSTRDGI